MRSQEEVAAMQCPLCRVPLAMSDRQGIEIDYCPQCRGVWLDRGELDKIIERSAPPEAPAQAPQAAPPPQYAPQQAPQQRPQAHTGPWGNDSGYRDDYGRQGAQGYGGQPHKRRKSWLEDIFD